MTQNFKGDELELQMRAAAERAFDICSDELDDYFDGAFEAADFLLMLYDSGRMPFSERVPRDSFVAFIKQAIPNAQFTGTFESYLFILESIFGTGTEVQFAVPAAGKLSLTVDVADTILYDMIGREFGAGGFSNFSLITKDGDQIALSGLSGIDSQAELAQLLAELIPGGISPTITLTFFQLSRIVVDYDGAGSLFSLIDYLGNEIVFYEPGA